jgi:uncharacterized coiled-coil DUF342 family protein
MSFPEDVEKLTKERDALQERVDHMTAMAYVLTERLDTYAFQFISLGTEMQALAKQLASKLQITPAQWEIVNKSKGGRQDTSDSIQ